MHIRILAERAVDFTSASGFVASSVWIVGETGLSFALVIPTCRQRTRAVISV
jgi:hypothetical protein